MYTMLEAGLFNLSFGDWNEEYYLLDDSMKSTDSTCKNGNHLYWEETMKHSWPNENNLLDLRYV